MSSEKETHDLIESWNDNASAWTEAVRGQQIESRKLITDAAIVDAIQSMNPRKVLDLGCGEGWLCRRLGELGVETIGIDVSLPLIESARAISGAAYFQCSYSEFCARPEALGRFDVAVANFSILDDDLVPILSALRKALNPSGAVIVQTVHPSAMTGAAESTDGWRIESFAGFKGNFPKAMPWYFRTLPSWQQCFAQAGLHVREIREPRNPKTQALASILFIAEDKT